MDDNTEKLLTFAGIGLGLYFVGKALINGLGGGNSAVATQQATPGAQNPFSPLFQSYLDNYYNGGASTLCTQYGGAQGLKAVYTATGGALNGSQSDLMVYAETIYNAFGYVVHEDNTALAAFAKVQDQCSIAYMSDYLNCVYQVDLLGLVNSGAWEVASWWTSGLSSTELTALIANVNALPEYVAIPAPPASLTDSGSSSAASSSGSSGGGSWYDALLEGF